MRSPDGWFVPIDTDEIVNWRHIVWLQCPGEAWSAIRAARNPRAEKR